MDILTKLEEVLQSRCRRLSKTQSTRKTGVVSLILDIILERTSDTVVSKALR